MSNKDLANAISECERQCSEAVDWLRDLDDRLEEIEDDLSEDVEPWRHAGSAPERHRNSVQAIRTAHALLGCLRRMAADAEPDTIHRIFGAPGDFGYDTPIGAALARVYRGAR